jgi:hypothetical protein
MSRKLLLTTLFLAACSQSAHPPKPGDTRFSNLEPANGAGPGRGGEDSTTPTAGANTNAPTAPSGRSGTVEEADIYRVDGSRLFYFNTYRGLLVFDVTDPKAPKQVGRAPVYGYPVEMFVEGNLVYALIRDSLYLTQVNGSLKFNRNNVSQLVTIDVTDPTQPKVLKTLDIIGELKEGVSRKIDDTIYVVSSIPQYYYYWQSPDLQPKEQAWVYSYNVKDARSPVEVQRLQIFEGGGQNQNTQNGSYSDYFEGVTISATANTLHVVENWQSYSWWSGSPYSCGSSVSYDQARVTIVDISDPSGLIKVQSKFNTPGHLTDQFKHTYIYDAASGHGYYLGIFARREWQSSNCSGGSFIQNNLEAWDITDGANPVRVSSLSFGEPNETVLGSTFDPDRKVAYAVTSRVVDPLYALSFADPKHLQILSEIDGLAGDMSLFRLIGGNKFLIGIGRDNSSACTGFGTPSTGWSTNVAVSIIDVQNLDKIRLVQRQCVSVKDAAWVSSQISWNLDQAHKMIGMQSDALANVISVPVSYYTKENATSDWWWYRWQSAVGVMTWDLGKYNAASPALATDVLVNHGTVVHPLGQVNRSILFTHPLTQHRTMVNLSDTHISVTDVQDLDHPVPQSVVEVAPYHTSIFRFGDYVVDQIYADGYYGWTQGASEFRVKRAAAGVDEAKPVASFTVGQVERVVKWKNNLLLFRRLPSDGTYPYYYGTESQMLVVDLSDPTQPVTRGSTVVPADLPYYWFWCGDAIWGGYWWYGDYNRWVTTERGLAFLTYRYDGTNSNTEIVTVDLSNLDAPTTQESVLAGSQFFGLVNDLADPNNLWLTLREGGDNLATGLTEYRYYAQRYRHEAGGISAGEKINLPGRLLRTWQQNGSRLFLASSDRYEYVQQGQSPYQYWSWIPQPSLHLLAQIDDSHAALQDSREYTDFQLRDLVGDGTRLFVELDRSYSYYARTNFPYWSETERLVTLDLSNLKLDQKFLGELGTSYAQLMGIKNDRLFVNLMGDGILVMDVSQLDHPTGQQFVRTLGWTTTLEFSNDLAFAPAGNFGIYTLDLKKPSLIAQVAP